MCAKNKPTLPNNAGGISLLATFHQSDILHKSRRICIWCITWDNLNILFDLKLDKNHQSIGLNRFLNIRKIHGHTEDIDQHLHIVDNFQLDKLGIVLSQCRGKGPADKPDIHNNQHSLSSVQF